MAGVLAAARPIVIIGAQDHKKSVGFYRDTLGLTLAGDDGFAAVFESGGAMLRVSTIPGFKPSEHAVLAFQVPDIAATVAALKAKGVAFNRYGQFEQDANGIWTAPDGHTKVAWFLDPDKNVLSIAQI